MHGVVEMVYETIKINKSIGALNERLASEIRKVLDEAGIRAFEFLGGPGAGKTSVIERVIQHLISEKGFKSKEIGYIGGDVATSLDTERIAKLGVQAIQINTGGMCHLESHHIATALKRLDVSSLKLLFIENVGNLVCPTYFRLGAHKRVLVLDAATGEDKVVKHPQTVRECNIIVINKVDIADAVGVNVDKLVSDARRVNPRAKIFKVSAKVGIGIREFAEELLS